MLVFQQFLQLRFIGQSAMPQSLGRGVGLFFVAQYLVHTDHGGVATLGKQTVLVIHIRDAAAHAGRKIATGVAQHSDGAAGHVFTPVVASAFHHRGGTGQTHGETLTGHAAEKRFAAGGAIQHGVADDDVAGGFAAEINAGSHHHAAAGQSFAGVIVGVADQIQRDAFG